VTGDEAHRLVALSFLSLYQMLRYLQLIESIADLVRDRKLEGIAAKNLRPTPSTAPPIAARFSASIMRCTTGRNGTPPFPPSTPSTWCGCACLVPWLGRSVQIQTPFPYEPQLARNSCAPPQLI